MREGEFCQYNENGPLAANGKMLCFSTEIHRIQTGREGNRMFPGRNTEQTCAERTKPMKENSGSDGMSRR